MHRFAIYACALLAALAGAGCSTMAPPYSASMADVQKLKDAGPIAAKVGTFASSSDPANANPITLRASSMTSPYGNSYAEYLAEAVKQELLLAGKLAPTADVEVSGVLLKNDISIASFSVGYGDISARFVVKKAGEVRYDQVKTAHTEFESSFAGAIAIPRGRDAYPQLVQSLLTTLLTDASFMEALK